MLATMIAAAIDYAAMFEKTVSLTNAEYDHLVERLVASAPGANGLVYYSFSANVPTGHGPR